MTQRTLIIAEAGVNHNGDINMAKRLIDVAAEAGADIVKFQTFSANRLVTESAKKADYQTRTTGAGESQHAMLSRLELTREMHEVLIEHCFQHGITFCSTGFDILSIDFLVELGIDLIKIPSGEITNMPYIRYIGTLGKPVILSTGMATLGEIEDALGVLEAAGTPRGLITVLHCNTEYPTPMCDVNLRAMLNIRSAFGVSVGYSDHTQGIEVPVAAVALGASVIEKHFTLDRSLTGPDHLASIEPDELKHMVQSIRNIEQALGEGVKRPSASELKNRDVARKSLVAACFIKAGEVFTENNLTTKRPGTGISAMRWDEVIGRKAIYDFTPNSFIQI